MDRKKCLILRSDLYELLFTGSTIVWPLNLRLNLITPYGIRLIFFKDRTFLVSMRSTCKQWCLMLIQLSFKAHTKSHNKNNIISTVIHFYVLTLLSSLKTLKSKKKEITRLYLILRIILMKFMPTFSLKVMKINVNL